MKITKATFKSFVRKNEGKLYMDTRSEFSGMIDGLEYKHEGFKKIDMFDDDLICGSRNYFTEYEDNNYKGIRVSNCCGSYIVCVKK